MMPPAQPGLSFSLLGCSLFTRHTLRRYIRLLIVCLLVTTALIVHLILGRRRAHHAPFEPPNFGTVVHGKQMNHAPQTLYKLDPFPESPMHIPLHDSQTQGRPQSPWLAAVICAASDLENRAIIRSTWMRLFQDVPFDGRFVVSNPGPQWTEIVATENRTFGDIIVLDHLQEDDITANTVKTLEFYKWLVSHNYRYDFVSKMDTDLWLNARGFWERFLLPRISNETGILRSTAQRTVIGELYYTRSWDLVFPHGSMYTVTWDMVEMLASLQSRFNVITGEDMAIAVLMLKGRKTASFVNFRGTEKFDYDDRDSRGDGTAWAREATHPNATSHAVYGTDAIAIHQLKDQVLWLKVADCFDENGVKSVPKRSRPDRTPFSILWFDFWVSIGFGHRYTSRLDRIPDFLWSFQNDSWVCDGIWNLGETKTGFQKT